MVILSIFVSITLIFHLVTAVPPPWANNGGNGNGNGNGNGKGNGNPQGCPFLMVEHFDLQIELDKVSRKCNAQDFENISRLTQTLVSEIELKIPNHRKESMRTKICKDPEEVTEIADRLLRVRRHLGKYSLRYLGRGICRRCATDTLDRYLGEEDDMDNGGEGDPCDEVDGAFVAKNMADGALQVANTVIKELIEIASLDDTEDIAKDDIEEAKKLFEMGEKETKLAGEAAELAQKKCEAFREAEEKDAKAHMKKYAKETEEASSSAVEASITAQKAFGQATDLAALANAKVYPGISTTEESSVVKEQVAEDLSEIEEEEDSQMDNVPDNKTVEESTTQDEASCEEVAAAIFARDMADDALQVANAVFADLIGVVALDDTENIAKDVIREAKKVFEIGEEETKLAGKAAELAQENCEELKKYQEKGDDKQMEKFARETEDASNAAAEASTAAHDAFQQVEDLAFLAKEKVYPDTSSLEGSNAEYSEKQEDPEILSFEESNPMGQEDAFEKLEESNKDGELDLNQMRLEHLLDKAAIEQELGEVEKKIVQLNAQIEDDTYSKKERREFEKEVKALVNEEEKLKHELNNVNEMLDEIIIQEMHLEQLARTRDIEQAMINVDRKLMAVSAQIKDKSYSKDERRAFEEKKKELEMERETLEDELELVEDIDETISQLSRREMNWNNARDKVKNANTVDDWLFEFSEVLRKELGMHLWMAYSETTYGHGCLLEKPEVEVSYTNLGEQELPPQECNLI